MGEVRSNSSICTEHTIFLFAWNYYSMFYKSIEMKLESIVVVFMNIFNLYLCEY